MTSTEVERYVGDASKSSIELAVDAWPLAQRLAKTDFVPRGLRGNPEATLGAMLTGHELGIGAMQSLAKIHVIDGRPGLAAELMRALILRDGHDFWIEESSGTRCTVVGKRKGSERETRFTWTHDDAVKAGLINKDNWKKYERAMLLARASTDLARAIFPDVIAGIASYEELLDGESFELEVPAEFRDGDETDPPPPAPRKATARARKAATRGADAPAKTEPDPAPPAAREAAPLPGEDDDADLGRGPGNRESSTTANADEEIVDAVIVDDDGDGKTTNLEGPRYTGPQVIAIAFGEKGVTDRDEKLRVCSAILGRKIDTTKDLTPDETTEILEVVRDAAFDARPLLDATAPEKTPPPAEETPPPPSGEVDASSSSSWSEGEWRAFVTARSVKVTELLKEAQRLAREDGDKGPGTLAALASEETASSLKELLVGFAEDLGLQRAGS